MKRAEKSEKIVSILEKLYPEPPVPLSHEDPYTLLCAVMLSAQTTDKKVNEVTPNLFAKADTPQKMAALSVETIRNIIKTVGLAPTKAKHLKQLSQQIVTLHQGKVPNDETALESLPGVGHKTASVVLSQAFGKDTFPVDTHIHRLAARWGLSDGKNVVKTERDLKKTFAKKLWQKLHLQIIYFGREYCPARNHDFSKCPICNWAASKKRMLQEQKQSSLKKP